MGLEGWERCRWSCRLVSCRKLELPLVLGTAQRESLSLRLPSLGPRVTAGDLLLERLNQSPVQSRLSPSSRVSRQTNCEESQ